MYKIRYLGWEVGRRFKMEGTYVYLWLIRVNIWQKPTQYCKAIILQLKTNSFSKKRMACLLMTLEPPAETGRGWEMLGMNCRASEVGVPEALKAWMPPRGLCPQLGPVNLPGWRRSHRLPPSVWRECLLSCGFWRLCQAPGPRQMAWDAGYNGIRPVHCGSNSRWRDETEAPFLLDCPLEKVGEKARC